LPLCVNDETHKRCSEPLSSCLDLIESLLDAGLLSPPSHPGVRARLETFEILKLIGSGGMGLVLLARPLDGTGLVAIKLLKPEFLRHPRIVHRFLLEVRHLQALSHPGLVSVMAVGADEKRPYFAMPFLDCSVASLLAGKKLPDYKRVVSIARQVGEALQYIHARGIIHRDIKPSNVLLAPDGRAFLADFGLAKTLFNDSAVDIAVEHFEGTAAYVSPQVASGEAEDTRCDIYAFGALLYEMLTGRAPYTGRTTKEVLKLIQMGPPPPISKVNSRAPASLARIAGAAMAREHRVRYASMRDILADLGLLEQGKDPMGPHHRWRPPKQWGRLVAIAAVVLGMLCLIHRLLTGSHGELELLHEIQNPRISDWVHTRVVKWGGDKHNDFLVVQQDQWYVLAGNGHLLSQPHPNEPPSRRLAPGLVADIDGDHLDEVFISWPEGTKVVLAAYNSNRWAVKQFHIPGTIHTHPAHGLNYSALRAETITDLEHDGSPDLLATIHTGWGRSPRGIACFEIGSQRLRWQCAIAPSPIELITLPLQSSESHDILLGSNAVGNGNKLSDGSDDEHSYIFAFNSQGQLLWRTECGGIYTIARPFAIASDSNRLARPFAWVEGRPENRATRGESEVGKILALDAATGRITNEYDAHARLVSCVSADLDRDGRSEILASDRFGYLHVLNDDLRAVRSLRIVQNVMGGALLRIVGVTNLTSSGSLHVVALAYHEKVGPGSNMGEDRSIVNVRLFGNAELLALSESLDVVARYPFGKHSPVNPDWNACLADVDGDHLPEIVAFGAQDQLLVFKFRQ